MILYLLTVTAVYDHGPLGVFTDQEEAAQYAKDLYEGSDGHHGFRIDPIRVDCRLPSPVSLGEPRSWRNKMDFDEMFQINELKS